MVTEAVYSGLNQLIESIQVEFAISGPPIPAKNYPRSTNQKLLSINILSQTPITAEITPNFTEYPGPKLSITII